MSQRTVVLDLESDHQLARDLVAGGVFVPERVELGEQITLVLRNGDSLIELHALCVYVDEARGSGLQLTDCDHDMKQQIIALASGMGVAGDPRAGLDDGDDGGDGSEGLPAQEPSSDEAPPETADENADADAEDATIEPAAAAEDDPSQSDEERKIALNVNERLRGLTVVQQLKVAQKGELSERIILERLYGKNVWEALLRNPRITGPEVARIARMGALPRPLMEIIVGNGGWLQIPEVRRALLSNPRLGTDQILRVLRLLPKHELKLAGMQTAYPFAVRDAAKRMLREMAG